MRSRSKKHSNTETMNHEKKVYLKILERFAGKDGTHPLWIRKPFIANNKTCSANPFSLVACPLIDKKLKDESERVAIVYPVELNRHKIIDVKVLRRKYDLFPVVDLYKEELDEMDCLECNKNGRVEWQYKDHICLFDCPVCDGEGVIYDEKKIPSGKAKDTTKYFEINQSQFSPDRIEELLFVAETLGQETVKLVYEFNGKGSMFEISDVDLIIMPSLIESREDIVKRI